MILRLPRRGLVAALALSLALPHLAALARAEGGAEAKRIVTLGGSVAEIAAAIGALDRMVARDQTATYPPEILLLPEVGYIRAISPEGVLAQDPDLIIAEGDAGPPEAVEVLKAAGIPFLTMPESPTPHGIIDKIVAVGEAVGLVDNANGLADTVARQLAEAEERAMAVTAKKRVLFLLTLQNGRTMVAGRNTSAEGIIDLAGGINAMSEFEGYKPVTDEALIAAAPDVILMMDRGGDLEILERDVLAHPALSETPAAADKAIVRMDGLLLLGFGPRTPEAARQLYEAIYGPAP